MNTNQCRIVKALTATLGCAALLANALAQDLTMRAPISPEVERAYQAILAAPAVRKALDDLKADDARTFEEQKRLTEIPAPPFKEKTRAEYFMKRMQEIGLADAYLDREGNAIGVRKGRGAGPKLVISAHLDTVFPEGTDVKVKEKDGRYFAPGSRCSTSGPRRDIDAEPVVARDAPQAARP